MAMPQPDPEKVEEESAPPIIAVSSTVERSAASAPNASSGEDELGESETKPGRAEAESGKGAAATEMAAENSSSFPAKNAGSLSGQTLISEQTGRQVAAAFGELSEAFASRNRKSLDEMAEEMLRPMLQDWLDNNLPTLVERLVREEIERVARGG
jgi:cell pole-organizing protein PopZ